MPLQITNIEELAHLNGPLHLALGVFDGVHLGHQAVIQKAIHAAVADGGMAIVVTFTPHPIEVIAPEKAPKCLLASLEEKTSLMAQLGIHGLLAIPFDHEFSQMEAEKFLEQLTQANVKTIAVGEDWRFGHKRLGNIEMLGEIAKQKSFLLHAVEPVLWDGERISSSRIREAISRDEIELAEQMLGRPYEVISVVMHGKKLGRTLGFPTANLSVDSSQTPSDGVWLVKVNGEKNGIANLGVRPTIDAQKRLLEVFLLHENLNLYGKLLRIRFLKKVRAEQKFESLEALKEQIQRDVEAAERYFAI